MRKWASELMRGLSNMFAVDKNREVLLVRPKLPLVLLQSPVISAVYLHIPEISFDVSASAFEGKLSDDPAASADPSNALLRVGTLPTTWLVVAGQESERKGQAQSRANLFITCAGGKCGAGSLRPAIGVFMNVLTTHPVYGVAVGKRGRTDEAHRRSQLGADGNERCLEVTVVDGWKLLFCASYAKNPLGCSEVPKLPLLDSEYLPSVILTLAENPYFESGQGVPAFNARANVTRLSKIDRSSLLSLLARTSQVPTGLGDVNEDSLRVSCDLNVDADGDVWVRHALQLDVGMAQMSGSPNKFDTLYAMMKLMDDKGTAEWEWRNVAGRGLSDAVYLIDLPINRTFSSTMSTRHRELYSLQGSWLTEDRSGDSGDSDIFGLVAIPLLDGNIHGQLISSENQLQLNLTGKDTLKQADRLKIRLLIGSDRSIDLSADVKWDDKTLLHTELGLSASLEAPRSIGLTLLIEIDLFDTSLSAAWPQSCYQGYLRISEDRKQLILLNASVTGSIDAHHLLAGQGNVTFVLPDQHVLSWTGSLLAKGSRNESYSSSPSCPSSNAAVAGVLPFDKTSKKSSELVASYSTRLLLGPSVGSVSLEAKGDLALTLGYDSLSACNQTVVLEQGKYFSCNSRCQEVRDERRLRLAPGLVGTWQGKPLKMNMTRTGTMLDQLVSGFSSLEGHVGSDVVNVVGSMAAELDSSRMVPRSGHVAVSDLHGSPWLSSYVQLDDSTDERTYGRALMNVSLGKELVIDLGLAGNLQTSSGVTTVNVMCRNAFRGRQLLDFDLGAEVASNSNELRGRISSLFIVNKERWSEWSLEGRLRWVRSPYGASLKLLKEGKEQLLLMGTGDYEWTSAKNLLEGAATTIVCIPAGSIDLDMDHSGSLTFDYRGVSAISLEISQGQSTLRSKSLRAASQSALLSLTGAASTRDLLDNSLPSFFQHFAVSRAGMDVAMRMKVSGENLMSMAATLESIGDLRGSDQTVSCIVADMGLTTPWLSKASTDMRRQASRVALLQYTELDWDYNDQQDQLHKSNILYNNQPPSCDASTTARLAMTFGRSCRPTSYQDDSGLCVSCPKDPHCVGTVTCTTKSDGKCGGTCISGYYKDANSRCIACSSSGDCGAISQTPPSAREIKKSIERSVLVAMQLVDNPDTTITSSAKAAAGGRRQTGGVDITTLVVTSSSNQDKTTSITQEKLDRAVSQQDNLLNAGHSVSSVSSVTVSQTVIAPVPMSSAFALPSPWLPAGIAAAMTVQRL
ncbi:hypothetical protein GUITHDRAFT_147586 [Guillardia theta CCMP2712]|uniref:Uncharacterized protein n=1 Tax=Guillardia theta (strain CCMP2712) TaxID=905079 RepID=L1ICV7_GUITC|nr:hypothetical protein GUITHDRAFT_147586 [Guillardia theta CCMP2712]EKX33912.1 hypothetical protein GUITHDRAFT_147586 [Guillardia theta CCMP2712]|eukprot:XP_005820892.1 hypothetical protein GUITHDRAFT_147586 [Guillardia theta CCMP2712]